VAVLSDYVRTGGGDVRDILDKAVRWIVNTQNRNGSWSSYGKETNEETAYSLLGLLHYHTKVEAIDRGVLSAAAKYLYTHYFQSQYETLWIGKVLYSPQRIVKSAIIGALYLYEQTFGSTGFSSDFTAQRTEDAVFMGDDVIR